MSLQQELSVQHKLRLDRELGGGSFATVYSVLSGRRNKRIALKLYKNQPLPTLMHELEIMKCLRCSYIVSLYKKKLYYLDPEHRFILLEFIDGRDLTSLMIDHIARRRSWPCSEFVVTHVARCLLTALRYIHAQNIIHNDVKPDNILCETRDLSGLRNTPCVKLCDFGLACWKSETSSRYVGTVLWCAPEKLSTAFPEPDEKADVFSVGFVLYALCTGSMPTRRRDEDFAFRDQRQRTFKSETRNFHNRLRRGSMLNFPHIAALIEKATRRVAGERATAAELLASLPPE